ncbi:MAG: DUF3613 domain-containing protein [Comamonadaceae bacterium]|nr:MAG: DUF3613 domain-containing protein [Comamonadaceae bacterium]
MSHRHEHARRPRARATSRIGFEWPTPGRPAMAPQRWRVRPIGPMWPMLLALLALLALMAGPTAAQPMPAVADAEPAASRLNPPPPGSLLPVGEATRGLLALQSDGQAASTTPRPLSGELASRSYQRYLKSFDHPIPASFGATIKSDK